MRLVRIDQAIEACQAHLENSGAIGRHWFSVMGTFWPLEIITYAI